MFPKRNVYKMVVLSAAVFTQNRSSANCDSAGTWVCSKKHVQ